MLQSFFFSFIKSLLGRTDRIYDYYYRRMRAKYKTKHTRDTEPLSYDQHNKINHMKLDMFRMRISSHILHHRIVSRTCLNCFFLFRFVSFRFSCSTEINSMNQTIGQLIIMKEKRTEDLYTKIK